jgi:hypothetical protein
MKKLLLAVNIMLLAAILFQACNKKPKANPDVPLTNETCTGVCKDYSGMPLPGIVTDNTLITKLSTDYANDMGKGNLTGLLDPAGLPQKDALSVCFSLEQLKNLIFKLEVAACKAKCTDPLGIRFYYIKYPSTVGTADAPADLNGLNVDCANKHSLIMVPAHYNNGYYHDFNISGSGSGCNFILYASKSTSDSLHPVAGIMAPTSGSTGSNHGDLGPPPAPGTYPTN